MITALYAALIGLLLVTLSIRVIALRGNPMFAFFAFNDYGDEALPRAIRGHANLIEYAPVFLILLMLNEQMGLPGIGLHLLGLIFVVGRVMHGICFGFLSQSAMLRTGGTALTLIPLIISSVTAFIGYF